jgi:hypothetical protein
MRQITQATYIKRIAPSLTALALGCALSSPARLEAQAADTADTADSAFNSGAASAPTPISEVPKGQQIPVASAQFDQGGYLVTERSGRTIDVPFADQNLEVMRFARSTTGETYLVNEQEGPVLYVPSHYFLVSTVGVSARWQPLPDTYVDVRPIYVSIAPNWDDFIHLDFYADMRWYGGVWGYRRGYLEAMPHRAVFFGGHIYGYEDYRRYAHEHPGAHISRSVARERAHSEARNRLTSLDRRAIEHRDAVEGGHRDTGSTIHNTSADATSHEFGHAGRGGTADPAPRQFGEAGHHTSTSPGHSGVADPAPHAPSVGQGLNQSNRGSAPAQGVHTPAPPASHPSTPKSDKKSSK